MVFGPRLPAVGQIRDLINKISSSIADASANVRDGSTLMIRGFGTAGIPHKLTEGPLAHCAKDLTIIIYNSNVGNGEHGMAALLKAGRVR